MESQYSRYTDDNDHDCERTDGILLTMTIIEKQCIYSKNKPSYFASGS